MNQNQPKDETPDVLDLLRIVAPERSDELPNLMAKYKIIFSELDDREGFVLQAIPAYGLVTFTDRTLSHLWLLAWVLWNETYCWSTFILAFVEQRKAFVLSDFEELPGQTAAYAAADALYSQAMAFVTTEPMSLEFWPPGIPLQRDIQHGAVEDRFVNDLAHHAVAFFILHEMRHIMVHEDGLEFSNPLDEEFECDRWATDYLLGDSDAYSEWSGDDPLKVKSKRAMGVVLGTVVMAHVQSMGLWEAGDEHPAITERMSRIIDHLDLPEDDFLWNISSSFLLAILRRRDAVPAQIEAKSQRELFQELLHQH